MSTLRVLFVGDVVGDTGCRMYEKHINAIRKEHRIDAVIVNGENSSARGRGITPRLVQFFKNNHADVITSGNHIWFKREIYSYLEQNNDLLRPANFPNDAPGVGVTTFDCKGTTIAVINVRGRVFMKENLDCPFRTVDSLLMFLKDKASLVFVDFHAEATSEKMAMGFYLDGRVSGIVGTHTHVPTADERILPNGTGFITDLGMAGSVDSMLGMQKEPIISNFLTQLPVRFEVATTMPVALHSVIMEVDTQTGKTVHIERIKVVDDNVDVVGDDYV